MHRPGFLALLSCVALSCVHPQDPPAQTSSSGDPQAAPSPGGGVSGPPGDSSAHAPAASDPAAPPSTPGGGDDEPAILAAHNRLRAAHCAPAMSWSPDLAAAAQSWADTLAANGCAFDHNPRTKHGENLSYFRPPGSLSPPDIAQQWYAEVDRYDFRNPGFSMEAGHFTQLVWAGTTRLGCGSARCGGGEVWVCNYDPAGNVHGGFPKNVQPAGCR